MRQLHDEPDPLKEAMIQRAEEVAEDLEGTGNKTLQDVTTEEERNNKDFCERLDELVLECVSCGWWCEASEMCDNTQCGDCCPSACQGEHDEA